MRNLRSEWEPPVRARSPAVVATMFLDSQAAAFLQTLEQANPPAIWNLSLTEARAAVLPVPGPPEPVADVRDVAIPSPSRAIPIRVYKPLGAESDEASTTACSPAGVTLFFHGGGWVTGSLESHDALARRLCNTSDSIVVAVDYSLSPERKFPAPVHDGERVARWAQAEFGLPLAVAGDSSGGNIAAGLCLLLRETSGPSIAAQALLYPATHHNFETDSYRENLGSRMLSRETMQWFWDQYLPSPEAGQNPYASPLLAESLAGLPPALIVTAAVDVLRDDGLAYASRLEKAGVPVERLCCEGMVHGFLRRLNVFDQATPVCRSIGEFLNRRFRDEVQGQ